MSRKFIPEQTLIDQLFVNDSSAFEELYHRYCFSLYTYCCNKLNSSEDAKKIVRDVFIGLWEKRHTLPIGFSISLFLYSAVRKAVLQSLNEKLENKKDLALIENTIIPGFAVGKLLQSRQPAKKMISLQHNPFPVFEKKIYKEPWWNEIPFGITINIIKQTFQKAFNLL